MSNDNLEDRVEKLEQEHEVLENRQESVENSLAAAVGNLRKHLASSHSIADVIHALIIFAGHFGGLGRGK